MELLTAFVDIVLHLFCSHQHSIEREFASVDRLGFRVPFVAVSPYAKRHHVSHVTYDHTSILKFIETEGMLCTAQH